MKTLHTILKLSLEKDFFSLLVKQLFKQALKILKSLLPLTMTYTIGILVTILII